MCRTTYDPECGYITECYCNKREKLEYNLEHVRDHFVAITDMLYGKSKWDKMTLERHLDEISSSLEIKISPHSQIAI